VPNSIRLTDLSVRALKFSDAQTTYWDDALPAFGVRVGRRTKTFIVVQSGGRRTKVGSYPNTSLQDARKAAKLLLASPPSPATRAAVTVMQAATLFLEAHAQKNRATSTTETARLLRKHFLPAFGASPLGEVTTDHIATLVDGLIKTPATANHAFAAMRTFFNWAVARRYLKQSPVAGLALPTKPGQRDRVLSESELVAIYRAALQMGHPFGHIVIVCIHTGMRRSEVATLKWSYITTEHITIPGELTKNGQQHILPNLIGDTLRRIPKTSEFLFSSDAGTPFSAWSKNKRKLDKRCDVADWVIHDLRRTFATKMAEWQIAPPHVIERILNHTVGSMTPIARIYNRWNYLAEIKDAMQRYEARLVGLLGASSDAMSEQVHR
jgi:integrase